MAKNSAVEDGGSALINISDDCMPAFSGGKDGHPYFSARLRRST